MSRTVVCTAYLRVSIAIVMAGLLFAAPRSRGQESATVVARELPDSPLPQSQQPTEPPKGGVTSTVVGYMTNRSLFFPDIATSPGPLSTGQKFKLFLNESVAPSSFLV